MKRTEAFPPSSGRLPDLEAVRRAASVLLDPGDWHELRGLPSGRSRLVTTADPIGLISSVRELADGSGVYYTLNPVRPDLGNNAAKVGDILRRRWLLIDVDRRKLTAPDDSATDAEKDAAWAVACKVSCRLGGSGWPEPLLIDSGNGYHLLYRVHLPNDDASRDLLSAVLRRLAKDHDSSAAEIDIKVHNASRIAKLPGTWACKGTQTPERPFRMAKLLDGPASPAIVPRELLEALASNPKDDPPAATRHIEDFEKAKRPSTPRESWLRKAIEGECAKVAMAPEGNRHDQLLKSAYALGGLLPHGLDRTEAESSLLLVGRRTDPGRTDHEAVIRDGLDAGAKEPRGVPDFERKPKGHVFQVQDVGENGLPGDAEVLTTCLADVEEEEIRWLWPNRIPLGMLTLLAGDQKVGKGLMIMDLAARVTTGGEIPGCDGLCMEIGSVVILTAEEGLSKIIRPRLRSAGGDPNKVHEFSGIRSPSGNPMAFDLSYVAHIEKAVSRFEDTRLLLIDPVTQYIPPGIDDSKAIQLRMILGPLVKLAERLDVAVLLIHHLNKGKGTKGLYRVSGSGAYTQVCRSNWLVHKDPKDKSRRLFLSLGTNLVADPSGLAYRIDPLAGRIVWDPDPVLMDADEILREERDESVSSSRKMNSSKVEQAEAWLNDLFSQAGITLPSDDVIRRGEAKGFDRDSLFVAKKRMGLKARKLGFKGGWAWFRPEDWPEESDRNPDSSGPPPDASDAS